MPLSCRVPALLWLKRYRRADAAADLLAGTITAVLLVPQAMAYAVVAGLPPETGLYASVLPSLAYALLGTSAYVGVGPVAVNAVMVASVLAAGCGDPATRVTCAMQLAAISAVTLLGLGLLRAGSFMNFLSQPVLDGFTSGAALLIVLTQLPALFGLPGHVGPLAGQALAGIAQRLAALHGPTAAIGLSSLVLLLLGGRPLRRRLSRLPLPPLAAELLGRMTPLTVVALATTTVAAADLAAHGVAVVGRIPPGLPAPSLGFLRAGGWLELLVPGVLIALISYVSSVSIAQGLASRRRERIDTDQELLALGAANAAAALGGALPVAASFSRSALNFSAGARTPLAGVVTALLVGAAALALTGLFRDLPKAALAALIVVAVAPLIDVGGFRRTLAYSRGDGLTLAFTCAAVLLLGVERGLLLGALLAFALYVWRGGHPHVAVLGRVPGTQHFRSVDRHRVETWPNLLLLRVDENLYFVNARRVEELILNHLAARPRVTDLILVGSGINHVDSTGRAMLESLLPALREAGVCTHLAEFKGPVLDRLKNSGLLDTLAPGRVFLSAEHAVAALAAGDRSASTC